MLALVFVIAMSFSLIASAATVMQYAELSVNMYYVQTARADSATGYARLHGYTSNDKAARFTILEYKSPYITSSVYSSDPLLFCSTLNTNYGALSYAGYMQQTSATNGAKGYVYIYAS